MKVLNHIKMEVFIKDNSKIINWMDMEYFNGKMVKDIRVFGKMILFVEKEYFLLIINRCMMEIFKKMIMINMVYLLAII